MKKFGAQDILIKLGPKEGCAFNDVVHISFIPAEILALIHVFEQSALGANNYVLQGVERDRRNLFKTAYDAWRYQRDKENKKDE